MPGHVWNTPGKAYTDVFTAGPESLARREPRYYQPTMTSFKGGLKYVPFALGVVTGFDGRAKGLSLTLGTWRLRAA